MESRAFRRVTHARPALRLLACIICFGLAGLIWSLPSLRIRRLRRAAQCRMCAAHQRLRDVAVFVVATLLLAGSLARLQTIVSPQIRCSSHISADGTIRPEPLLHLPVPQW